MYNKGKIPWGWILLMWENAMFPLSPDIITVKSQEAPFV